jgi:hypothetical protein
VIFLLTLAGIPTAKERMADFFTFIVELAVGLMKDWSHSGEKN